ncbi:MAG: hypothetical protein M1829_001596 [Trizodia sp. TS-e1964]|nr:MAG: hypothetical protein M1829_001596 [Trizodia sp. TS-e1964]
MSEPAQAASETPIAHSVAPSVDAAYRQKCIDLKRRMQEVETTNDEMRLRKHRLGRGILKLRLERAFLLEQLEKRSGQAIDDSEFSSSAPPTPQEEKLLRTKHGHRKSSFLPGNDGSSPTSSLPGEAATPSKAAARRAAATAALKASGAPRRPPNAYMLYCEDTRERLKRNTPSGEMPPDILMLLAVSWNKLDEEAKRPYYVKYDERKKAYDESMREHKRGLEGEADEAVQSPAPKLLELEAAAAAEVEAEADGEGEAEGDAEDEVVGAAEVDVDLDVDVDVEVEAPAADEDVEMEDGVEEA